MQKKYQPIGTDMRPSRTKLGRFLRTRRLKLGLRQVEVAECSGLFQTHYSSLEIGKYKNLKPEQVKKLAEALQCDSTEIQAVIPVKAVKEPTTELGKLIRARREELRMSIETFARRMKVKTDIATRLEIRKAPSISSKFIPALAKALVFEADLLLRFAYRRAESKTEVGKCIRDYRIKSGLPNAEIALKLGVSRNLLNGIELGTFPLSNRMAEELARILKCDANELKRLRPKRKVKQKVTDINTLEGFLTHRRLELGLTLREVGEKLECSTQKVHLIENGIQSPEVAFLSNFESALECKIPKRLL